MNTTSPMTLDRALSLYSVDASTWWDGAGDTDQMLGLREWIEARYSQLTDDQKIQLQAHDEQVLRLCEGLKPPHSWDASMLMQTGRIARAHCAQT